MVKQSSVNNRGSIKVSSKICYYLKNSLPLFVKQGDFNTFFFFYWFIFIWFEGGEKEKCSICDSLSKFLSAVRVGQAHVRRRELNLHASMVGRCTKCLMHHPLPPQTCRNQSKVRSWTRAFGFGMQATSFLTTVPQACSFEIFLIFLTSFWSILLKCLHDIYIVTQESQFWDNIDYHLEKNVSSWNNLNSNVISLMGL